MAPPLLQASYNVPTMRSAVMRGSGTMLCGRKLKKTIVVVGRKDGVEVRRGKLERWKVQIRDASSLLTSLRLLFGI